MPTGTACSQSYPLLKEHLVQMAGVRHVDFETVPDHILIDADTATVSAAMLEAETTRILSTQPPCRAEIMKSCISTDLRLTERTGP